MRQSPFRRCIAIPPAMAVSLLVAALPALGHDTQRVAPLMTTGETVLGQPLSYPTRGMPQIQSSIVTMLPGEETGLHSHPHLTYGYILHGELTVSYQGGVTKTYRKGEAFMEAVDTQHNGRNTGSEPMRVLVVFIGIEGEANTILSKKD